VRILELLDRLGLASVPCLMAVGWSAKSRSGPQRGEEAPSKACLDTYQSEFRQRILPKSRRRYASEAGQRLGPKVGGGAKRGTGCWSNGLVVVRLVAGIASGVA
jgi:hypothetical protein